MTQLSPDPAADPTDPVVWNPEEFVGVDLLAGGPPCPPFSDAGRRLGATDERDLFAWSIGLVARIRPRAVLLENVRGLSRPRFAGYRQAVVNRLAGLGYVTDWRIIQAHDHGVPQSRPRYVLVALSREDSAYFHWPEPQDPPASVGEALRGPMAAGGWLGASAWSEAAAGFAPTIVGGSRKHGGADLGPTGSRRRWAALGVNGRSVADSPPDSTFPMDGAPRLTPTMLALLQGFPTGAEEWHFTGTKTSRCRQIGNAFPPPLAEALGRSIASALRHEGPTRPAAVTTVHCPVFSALTRHRGRYVGTAELRTLGLNNRAVTQAIDRLTRDFQVESAGAGDDRRFRLLGWRPDVTSHDDHLPLCSDRVEAA